MHLAYLITTRQTLGVHCECGNAAQLEALPLVLRFGEQATLEGIQPKLRCTRCGSRKVTVVHSRPDEPRTLANLTEPNIWHRCRRDPCFHEFWTTVQQARSEHPGGTTLTEYAASLRCPSCGLSQISMRPTFDALPSRRPYLEPSPQPETEPVGLNPRWLPPVRSR